MCLLFPLRTGFARLRTPLCSLEEEVFQKEKDFSLQPLPPPDLRGRARAGLGVRDHFCLINLTEHPSQKSPIVVVASFAEAPYGQVTWANCI